LILDYDKGPAYFSLRVSQFLVGKGISAMDHLPYTPELAPADFWLLPKLKSVLKGERFSDIEDIKLSVEEYRQTFLFRILKLFRTMVEALGAL
jgi:hypothetical protein